MRLKARGHRRDGQLMGEGNAETNKKEGRKHYFLVVWWVGGAWL
jgi:hypothetical protein